MKIDVNKIPAEGLTLVEELSPLELGLETDTIKFNSSIKITADISRISNVVSVNLNLNALMHTNCSRCLDEFEIDFKKNIGLNYPVNPVPGRMGGVNKSEPVIDASATCFDFAQHPSKHPEPVEGLSVNGERPSTPLGTSPEFIEGRSRTIDLDPDIREELILDYPIKPLCKPDCKGLCPKCGKNLNQGGCSCGTT